MKIIKNSKPVKSDSFESDLFVVERKKSLKALLLRSDNQYQLTPDLFLDFIKPFSLKIKEVFPTEQMLYIGMTAWNVANIKSIAPGFYPELKMEADEELDLPAEIKDVFEKLILRKETNFKESTDFIIDFEIIESAKKEKNGLGFKLILSTKSKDDFLLDPMRDYEDEINEIDFEDSAEYERSYIDRSVVMIFPKQPFVEWTNGFKQNYNASDLKQPNVYLVNVIDNRKKLEQWVKKNYEFLLITELNNFDPYKTSWPANFDYKMFNEWFEIKMSYNAFDMEEMPITKK